MSHIETAPNSPETLDDKENNHSLKEKFEKIIEGAGTIYDSELLEFSKDLVSRKTRIQPLFRFSPANYDNIRNLETQELYLSPAGLLNDVFEGLSCEVDDKVISNLDKMSDFAYVKSFSESRENLLMWAHYADNYSGMCVEYDLNNLDKSILYHLFPVFYSNEKIENSFSRFAVSELDSLKRANKGEDDFCDDGFFLKDLMAAFLIKSLVWSYENEWRIIVTHPQMHNTADDISDNDCSEFYEVDNQVFSVKSCIKGVYLGPRMKQRIKNHIKEICRDRIGGVPVYEAHISKEEYKIEFVKCEDGSRKGE